MSILKFPLTSLKDVSGFFVEVHPSFPVIDEERKEIETVTCVVVRTSQTLRSSSHYIAIEMQYKGENQEDTYEMSFSRLNSHLHVFT